MLEETRIITTEKEDGTTLKGIISDLAESALAEKTYVSKNSWKIKASRAKAGSKKATRIVLTVRRPQKGARPRKYSFTVIDNDLSDTGERTVVASDGGEKIIGRVTETHNAMMLAQNAHLLGGMLPPVVGVADAGGDKSYIFVKAPQLPMGLIRDNDISLNNPYALSALVQKISKLHDSGALLGGFSPKTVAFTKKGAYITDIRNLTFVKKGESAVGEFLYVLASLVKENAADMENIPKLVSEYISIQKNKEELDRYFSDPLAYSRMDRGIYSSVMFEKRHRYELKEYSESTLATLVSQKVARYRGVIAMLHLQKKGQE
ncbi:MAG: hypothetical protein WC506_00450 [Candidatus Micrarchaeia archaeon]